MNYQLLLEIIIFLATVLGMGWKVRTWLQTNLLTRLDKIEKQLEENSKTTKEAKTSIDSLSQVSKYELGRNGGGSTKDIVVKTYNICKEFQERDEIHFYLDQQAKFECDANGYTIKLNKKLLEILGVLEEQGLGYGWVGQLIEADKQRVLREWEEAIVTNSEFSSVYTFINRITGAKTKVKGTAVFKRNEDKEITLVIGALEILEEHQAKSQLRVV